MDYFVSLLASVLSIMLVITLHEFAHAFVAYKCGDPTAKFAGRMTLNPVKHFDLLGIVMFAVAGFGWAKPVPVNPYNFKNPKSGALWTSAAGVIVNYLTAFLFYPILAVVILYLLPAVEGTYAELFFYSFFVGMLLYSLSFCVFNLLPFYPLDGFRIIDATAKRRGQVYQFLYQYGYYVLLGLIFLHVFASRVPMLGYIDLLGYALTFVRNVLSQPISLFWNWIFGLFGVHIPFTL